LSRKPKTTDSYARTRKEISMKLATAKVRDAHMFVRVGNIKIEDEKFTVLLRLNSAVTYTGDVDKQYESFSDDWRREFAIDDMLIELENWLGVGPASVEGKTDEERKTKDAERKKRLVELEKQGILPVSHLTSFEEKDFET